LAQLLACYAGLKHIDMLKNFFLITLRNTIRDKAYFILNVLGLSLGIAGSILILLYVQHEISYDKFHKKADRIYRINCYAKLEGKEISIAVTAPPQARVFKEEYPEVEDATRYYYPNDQKVSYENVTYHEKRFYFADPNFLEMFNFPLIKGDPKTALQKPFSVIITSAMAEKLFGRNDPMGKNIVLNNDKVYQITGIIQFIPVNTHFRFDYLASFNSLELSKSELWLSQMLETFIVIQKDYSYKKLEAKFEGLMDKFVLPQIQQFIPIKVNNYKEFEALGNKFQYTLQPLSDLHFSTHYSFGYDEGTDRVYIYFFSVVAIFLLFIACINFMNLSTAKFSYRSKEVGIKKVMGSSRSQLISQFLSESLIITLVAMIISLTLVELVLPSFNRFTGKDLAIGYLNHWYIIPSLIAVTLLIGFLAGIYPAFYLSSFKPAEILKAKYNRGTGNIRLRSALVIVQFSITIILLISTFIVSSQLKFIRSKDLGFNKENVLVVKNTGDLADYAETFREKVLKMPNVIQASRTWTFPGEDYNGSTFQIQGDSLNKMYQFEIIQGDYDYLPLLGFKIISGRNFSRDFATDNNAILINESAVKFLGVKDPLGVRLTTPNGQGGQDVLEIIGVFQDVYYKSFHEKIEPMMLSLNTDKYNAFTLVRVKGDLMGAVKQVEKTWNEFMPGQAFEYVFFDENFDKLYHAEIRAGRVFTIFSALAVFVACLGLLGLSAFSAEKRTKEIGIRKVHGASVPGILRLLSTEIVILITISSVIAWPVVYYFMHKWLQNFAYQTTMHFLTFLLSSCIGLFIAISVVIYQSLKVARVNPVEALKYE
jgi:putative ABC transport system permease protein